MNNQTTITQSTDAMGRFLALGSAAFLGLNTTLARLAYDSGSNSGTVVFLRISLTALAIGILIVITRRDFSVPKVAILPLIGASVSLVLQGTSYLSSVSYIPVGLAALLFYTYPLMVAAASQVVDQKKIDIARLFAFGAAFIGISMAVGPSLNVLDWHGIVLALMGAFGVMTTFMFTSRALKYMSPISVSFYSNLFAMPMMAMMMTLLGGFQPPTTGIGIAGLTSVCVFYGLAYLMLSAAIHSIGKTMTALLSNLEPLVSIIAAALILGESMSGIQYFGGLVLVVSLVTGDSMARRRSAQ